VLRPQVCGGPEWEGYHNNHGGGAIINSLVSLDCVIKGRPVAS